MEGKRKLSGCFLITLSILLISSCSTQLQETATCRIKICCTGLVSRAMDPQEELISDVSIMIFDETGMAEECIWIPQAQEHIEVTLVKGKRYHVRACANFGYQVYADRLNELDEVRYHMAYPDEYREGIPMCAEENDVIISEDALILLTFKRLMAKISIRIDRSKLSDDIEMDVRSVRIGNCPKSVKVFGESCISGSDQCFTSGFSRTDYQTDILNRSDIDGKSGRVSLYMLENMQGKFPDTITSDTEKVFDKDDPRSEQCSYIEMEMDYHSSRYASTTPLIYRFYLGENMNNLDVERNCHYDITVCPENDGLSDDGWRVDKSGLEETGEVYFKAYPQDYIRGNIGDKIHIWCEFSPANTSFDVGLEYMEDDKAEGIYDYELDPDGHGATLTLTGPGRGLIYMEAGAPIDDAALFVIEVNKP